MKTLFSGLTVASLFLFMVSELTAKGIFITPGTRANGIGAAYTAIAEDATAIYWNPAGLAQLNGSGAEVSAFYLSDKAISNTSLSNLSADTSNGGFPFTRLFGTEPAEFKTKEFKTAALVPFMAGYRKVKDITIAVGYYGSGGGGGKWNDDEAAGTDQLTAVVDALYSFTVANISAAKQLTPKLMAGLGIDFITMNDKKNIQKSYIAGAASGLPNYHFGLVTDAVGYGIQFNGGLMYKIQDNLRAGLVLRSGATLKLTGKGKFVRSGLAVAGMPDAALETDFDQNYPYPFTCALGASFEPRKDWTLSGQVDLNNYSSMKTDITYKNPVPGAFVNSNASSDWKDTTQIRIGAEYRMDAQWSFRGGIQTDPAPLPTDKFTLLELNQYNMTYLTVGAGYNICSLTMDVSYARGISDKPGNAGREYEYPISTYRLSAGYKF